MENDESWYPTTESLYKEMGFISKLGRLLFPVPLFACEWAGRQGFASECAGDRGSVKVG